MPWKTAWPAGDEDNDGDDAVAVFAGDMMTDQLVTRTVIMMMLLLCLQVT